MDRKTALMNSAEKAVRIVGYDGFSYADLAEEVGIRKASIHYHFPTKADLALEIMKRYNEITSSALRSIYDEAQTASECLLGLVAHYRNALEGGKQLCLCVAFSISPDNLSEELKLKLEEFRSAGLTWLESVFERGIEDGSISNVTNVSDEAASCLATLEGAHLVARAQQDISRFDEATRLISNRATPD